LRYVTKLLHEAFTQMLIVEFSDWQFEQSRAISRQAAWYHAAL